MSICKLFSADPFYLGYRSWNSVDVQIISYFGDIVNTVAYVKLQHKWLRYITQFIKHKTIQIQNDKIMFLFMCRVNSLLKISYSAMHSYPFLNIKLDCALSVHTVFTFQFEAIDLSDIMNNGGTREYNYICAPFPN